jgi:gliding motility-associated lipoprotein GldH
MKTPRYLIILLLVIMTGCASRPTSDVYFTFRDNTWYRFNKLDFLVPVEKTDDLMDVVMYVRHNDDFPFRSLDFHMIMNTPSGEERIKEYHLILRDTTGKLTGTPEEKHYVSTMVLKRELRFMKTGTLEIELENLIPRMKTPGLIGIGIRLEKSSEE